MAHRGMATGHRWRTIAYAVGIALSLAVAPAAAQDAVVWTMFHYGVAGWAMYALLGMAMGYFAYRWGMPLSIRAALYPLLGKRVRGGMGDAIDIVTLVGTVFGVATSMGIGVVLLNVGFAMLFGLPQGLAPLRRRLGRDQVGDALRGREVQLAVQEGAAGELPRLGRAGAGGDQGLRHAGDHRRPAVQVQFRRILAGVAARPGEPEHQGVVQHLATLRVAQAAQRGHARCRQAAAAGQRRHQRRAGRRDEL